MKTSKLIINIITIFLCVFFTLQVQSQSIKEMDRNAEKHFQNREFSKAIGIWLNVLSLDPNNEEIQKKIERIYEIKQKKDLALQRAKIYAKIAKKQLEKLKKSEDKMSDRQVSKSIKKSRKRTGKALKNFVIAYRIDPKDPEMRLLRDDMKYLDEQVKAEEEKNRLSRALKRKVKALKVLAKKAMDEEKYKDGKDYWQEILGLVPLDKEAQEGKRKCILAIENRLKYERIRNFIFDGKKLFKEKKYKLAKIEFKQVKEIDPDNREARDFIEEIDEKLDKIRNFEVTRLQAEEFYKSGIKHIRENKFKLATEDFESCLALIEGYKDAKQRLKSIGRLRKDFVRRNNERKLRKINREFQEGLIALSDGRYKEAIRAFEITISLDPDNKLAKQYIVRAKDAQSQVEEERVDRDSPYYNIVSVLMFSGKKLFEKGEYAKSKSKWDDILKLFPQNKIATEYILKCELKLNPKAYRKFSERIVKEGRGLLKKKKYSAAKKKFELIKSISANYPGIDGLIARSTRGMRKSSGVLSPVDRTAINIRYRRAMGFYKRGGRSNIRKALNDFTWIVKRDPNNTKAVISMNKIQSQLRIGRGGVRVTRKRLNASQQQKLNRYYYRGISYYTNNNFKRAIQSWRRVLAIDPGHVKARNNIRKCLAFLSR
ncbi:tetratricopeptide repeat protein [Spirochaetota bacterium]